MALPQTDPSLPSNPSPIFGDIDAARGDHLRANNNIVWQNLTNLDTRIDANWVRTIFGDNLYGSSLVTNLDNIAKSGFYTAYGTATGVPSTSYSWFILHQNSAVGVVSMYQRAVAYGTTLIVMERTKIASTWGAWAVSGNVITSDTSSTDGEIVVESGTGGKTIKKSGTLLSTIITNITNLQNLFTGEEAKVASELGYSVYASGAASVGYAIGTIARSNRVFVAEGVTDSPNSAIGWLYVTEGADIAGAGSKVLTAYAQNTTKESWRIVWASNNYSGWTQLTDANGNAMTANNALSFGGKNYAALFDANGRPVLASAYVPTRHNLSSGERAGNTTYTNATGKDMVVCVYGYGSSGSMSYAIIDNLELLGDGYTSGKIVSFCFPVPAGSTYKVVFGEGTQTITRWAEIY